MELLGFQDRVTSVELRSSLTSLELMSATATLTIFFQARATSGRVVQRVEVEGKGFKSKRVEGKEVESKSKEFRGSGSRRATVSRGIKGLGQRS